MLLDRLNVSQIRLYNKKRKPMPYRIIHCSDTHLGYSDIERTGPDGINLREADIYAAFTRLIDRIIDIKPDAVVHSGDLFHRPSPANRPMVECLTQLKRLSNEGIPCIIIAGNHSTPRSAYTSPILKALSAVSGVYPFFGQQYETLKLGNAVFHALPHINDDQLFFAELDKMKPVPGAVNIALLHSSVGKKYMMDEFGERVIDASYAEKLSSFNYTALGHWHGFQSVEKFTNAFYSGSTERLSDRECAQQKGFIIADIDADKTAVSFEALPVRPWIRIDIEDCGVKTGDIIAGEIGRSAASLNNAIVSVYLQGLRQDQGCGCTNADINALFPAAAAVLIRRIYEGGSFSHAVDASQQSRIEDLFEEYAASSLEGDTAKDQLIALGRSYFTRFDMERGN